MAYISKEQVQEKRKLVSALCKKYNVSATVSGSNSSRLTATIRKGKIDFLGNYADTVKQTRCVGDRYDAIVGFRLSYRYVEVDPYNLSRDFSGDALKFINELLSLLKMGYCCYPDIDSDFPWFISVWIGEWGKPYVLTPA